ncbi:MAG: hypothetical protein RLZZ127_2112 [Planctomycetota bacterium]|jgi:putative iron-regulated protein
MHPKLLNTTLLLLALAGASPAADLVTPAAVADTTIRIARHTYGEALAAAKSLQSAIDAFTAAPSEAGLAAARSAWRRAHDAYSPTEVFRFVNGPIDHAEHGVETRINAWPLDEQWLDATIDQPGAGLVGATAPITAELLREANEQGGEKNIATGFHAIEFLLWGQDRDPAGPGARPVGDFTTAAHAERRRQTLRILGALLVEDLTTVHAAWADGAAHPAALRSAPATAVEQAFIGMTMLIGDELSGERMAVAWETQDQEEEQSCFSDHTLANHLGNHAGAAMLWSGTRGPVQGPGLRALVSAADPAGAARLDASIAAAGAALAAIPAPFDQAILGGNDAPGRIAVLRAIEALEEQAEDTVSAAKAVGVAVEFGANPNNAIVGFGEMRTLAAQVAAGDAQRLVGELDQRWLRHESAVRGVDPILYKTTESALQALRSAAVRARTPDPAAVAAAVATLDARLADCVAKLKQE